MSFAVAGPYTKADYQSNPVFVGEWKDRTAMVERTFRIIRNDAVEKRLQLRHIYENQIS